GRLPRHYAPDTGLILLAGQPDAVSRALAAAAECLLGRGRRVGLLVADEDQSRLAGLPGLWGEALGALADNAAAAYRLYAAVRRLDAAGVDWILARDWGEAGLGPVLRDRLTRAAEGRVLWCDEVGDPALLTTIMAADAERYG